MAESLHMKIRMEVFGKEYQATELTYSVTSLELVKVIQDKLAGAILDINKMEGVTKEA